MAGRVALLAVALSCTSVLGGCAGAAGAQPTGRRASSTAQPTTSGSFTGKTPSGDQTISFRSDGSEITAFHVTGLWLCSASGTLSSFTYTIPGTLAIQPGGAFTGVGTDSGPDVPGPLSWKVSGTVGADGSVSGLLSLSLNDACGIEPDTPWTATHS